MDIEPGLTSGRCAKCWAKIEEKTIFYKYVVKILGFEKSANTPNIL